MNGPKLLQRQVPSGLIWVLVAFAFALFGQVLQARVHLNHDVSWIAHSARWLLKGGVMGADVLDTTPPIAWFLSLPAAALADLELLSEPTAVRLVYWAYFLVSALLLFRVLTSTDSLDRAAQIGWKSAFVVVATLAPGFSFGQREYASVLFAMPYLGMAAVRLQGGRDVERHLCIAVGVLAGVAFSIKPYFLAVPLLVEGWLAIALGWRVAFRAESIAFAATILAHVVATIVFAPDYLTDTVPLVRSVYWAYDAANYSVVLTRYLDVAEPALYGLLIAMFTLSWTRHHTVMALAGLGYSVSYLVQAKGFVYHAYPVLVCAFLLLGISVATGIGRVFEAHARSSALVRLGFAFALACLAVTPVENAHQDIVRWYLQYDTHWGSTGRFRQAVIDLVNEVAPSKGSYFFAFSTHPFPGFPTASYTAAEWSGRAALQFIIPAYARIDEVSDSRLRDSVIRAAKMQRSMIVDDLRRRPPSIVFIERNQQRLGLHGRAFDDLAFYTQDPAFEKIWINYDEREPLGPLRVFVRRVGREGRAPQ